MKIIVVIFFLLNSVAFGNVQKETSITFGYHSFETLSLKSYKKDNITDNITGYAIIKAIQGREVRFQKLSLKEYKLKESQLNQVLKKLTSYKIQPISPCSEKIEIKSKKLKRAPASDYYCWDSMPENVKLSFKKFWLSN